MIEADQREAGKTGFLLEARRSLAMQASINLVTMPCVVTHALDAKRGNEVAFHHGGA